MTRRELLAAGGGLAWQRLGRLRTGTADVQLEEVRRHDTAGADAEVPAYGASGGKRLGDFQQLTGSRSIGRRCRGSPAPEVKVEHLGGGTDLDVFLSYWAQDGQQFMTSGWYVDTLPMIRNAQMTNADFNWDDFIRRSARVRPSMARYRSFPIARRPFRSCNTAVICSHNSSSIVQRHGTTCAMQPR